MPKRMWSVRVRCPHLRLSTGIVSVRISRVFQTVHLFIFCLYNEEFHIQNEEINGNNFVVSPCITQCVKY